MPAAVFAKKILLANTQAGEAGPTLHDNYMLPPTLPGFLLGFEKGMLVGRAGKL